MSSSTDVVSFIHRSYDQPIPENSRLMTDNSHNKTDSLKIKKDDIVRSADPDVRAPRKPERRVRFPDGEVISNYLEPFRPGQLFLCNSCLVGRTTLYCMNV
ncbi:hypothetical protein FGIG_09276 [Fasciola gigantica]|uniref:Uncharacterized protein n=2 Tax=Fasciola TaxID=6191 RepID=A0A504Z3Q7_FASGI|nr:hypothetical protein FGIG_09276 [Fasciola gigantica]